MQKNEGFRVWVLAALLTSAWSGTSFSLDINKCKSPSSGLDETQKGILEAIRQDRQSSSNQFHPTWPPQDRNSSFQEYVVTTELNGHPYPIKAERVPSTIQPPKGTVVLLCGGPLACVRSRYPNIPADFDLVVSDYIGTGNNDHKLIPPEAMSIESQAIAIRKVIEALKLKNYLFYGISFGTTVATVAAAQIAKDAKAAQPKAVILEGVIGSRTLMDDSGFVRASNRAMALLSPPERLAFKQTYSDVNKQLNALGQALLPYEFMASLYDGPKAASEGLKKFINSKAKRFVKLYPSSQQVSFNLQGGSIDRLDQSVGCQSQAHPLKNPPDMLFDGTFPNVVQKIDYCACRTINRDYDSKDFQIHAPILYIEGTLDPVTPIENGRYHFQNQREASEKVFLEVQDGGHGPATSELQGCHKVIFDAAISGHIKELAPPKDLYHDCGDSNEKIFPSPTTQ